MVAVKTRFGSVLWAWPAERPVRKVLTAAVGRLRLNGRSTGVLAWRGDLGTAWTGRPGVVVVSGYPAGEGVPTPGRPVDLTSERLGRHRWISEACLSGLTRNRRLVRCYDRKAEHFQAFTDIACAIVTYRLLTKITK
jgi:hypothetical protein